LYVTGERVVATFITHALDLCCGQEIIVPTLGKSLVSSDRSGPNVGLRLPSVCSDQTFFVIVIGCDMLSISKRFCKRECHGKSITLDRVAPDRQKNIVFSGLCLLSFVAAAMFGVLPFRPCINAIPRFGDKYANLEPRVLHELCLATEAKRPLATRYGGFVALSLFGPRAIASFLLPLATDHWNTWQQTLDETTNLEQRLELQMFQQAILVCIENVVDGV
jgi:hypothetical protein